ncbi:porin family protein [Tenacibaculum aiptasiae]|uniref:Porin family protein n=1 Tax=Tenacibaculum aiptasiae TaxID=426481 RepID=A0A7J5AAJ4_9FLAO|nr:outer membrane beta-barrel protein [Tenacibaculum aiptasiae]KAB1154570.1 porin family protein [Tenacibaculum aiptasiae]
MKKLLLCTMLIALSFAYGQESTKKEKLTIQKGTWYLNGGMSLVSNNSKSNQNMEKSDQIGFNFSPKIGFSINNNLIIGLGLGYNYHKNDLNFTNTKNFTKNESYSIFPYIKKYFSLGQKLAFTLHGEFRYTYSKYENDYNSLNNTNLSKANYYFIGIRPGITYFLNKKIALEANIGALGYTKSNHTHFPNNSIQEIDNFNFNLNSSNLNFGISYYW